MGKKLGTENHQHPAQCSPSASSFHRAVWLLRQGQPAPPRKNTISAHPPAHTQPWEPGTSFLPALRIQIYVRLFKFKALHPFQSRKECIHSFWKAEVSYTSKEILKQEPCLRPCGIKQTASLWSLFNLYISSCNREQDTVLDIAKSQRASRRARVYRRELATQSNIS